MIYSICYIQEIMQIGIYVYASCDEFSRLRSAFATLKEQTDDKIYGLSSLERTTIRLS
jgi:hypothetical protein